MVKGKIYSLKYEVNNYTYNSRKDKLCLVR